MKRLPKIEDTKLMTRIARLQSNTDFIDFKDWLLSECEKCQLAKMREEYQDRELHMLIGVLQILDDLQELFSSSEEWSLNMQQLAIKKAQGR
jgi:hypothetical protein